MFINRIAPVITASRHVRIVIEGSRAEELAIAIVSQSRAAKHAMANINFTPRTNGPANSPEGVRPLYDFFLSLMNHVMSGVIYAGPNDTHSRAYGFNGTGPIMSEWQMQEYKNLLNEQSMGHGVNAAADADDRERVMLHVLWLNHVVPKALRHAHADATNRLAANVNLINPEVVNHDGHHRVAKLVLALLDVAIRESLAGTWLRQMIEDDHEDGDLEVHGDHYYRCFGHVAESVMVFDITLDVPINENF